MPAFGVWTKAACWFLPLPTLLNSTRLRWDGTESAKRFRKTWLLAILQQQQQAPFCWISSWKKRIKVGKKGALVLLLSPFPAQGDTDGAVLFLQGQRKNCRAAGGLEGREEVGVGAELLRDWKSDWHWWKMRKTRCFSKWEQGKCWLRTRNRAAGPVALSDSAPDLRSLIFSFVCAGCLSSQWAQWTSWGRNRWSLGKSGHELPAASSSPMGNALPEGLSVSEIPFWVSQSWAEPPPLRFRTVKSAQKSKDGRNSVKLLMCVCEVNLVTWFT